MNADGSSIELSCGIRIPTDSALADDLHCDVLVLVGGFRQAHHWPDRLLPKLNRAAQRAQLIFGVESGTWLLARAGLIQDHRVTTHWEDVDTLGQRYRNLNVVADRFVIDRSIWTSGGASPTVDMMLHYFRHHFSQALALEVANIFIYQGEQAADRQQTDLALQRLQRREPRLAVAINLMKERIESPIKIAELASKLTMGKRTFEKHFKDVLHETPASYYLHLRLNEARRLVMGSNSSLLEISLRTGFNSATSFSRAFKRYFGISPSQLRLIPKPT